MLNTITNTNLQMIFALIQSWFQAQHAPSNWKVWSFIYESNWVM